MEPDTLNVPTPDITEPLDAAPVETVGSDEAPVAGEPIATPPAPTPIAGTTAPVIHTYPSLYDTKATTVIAILFGIAIIGGIQIVVSRIFTVTKDAHRALTHFTVSMVALIVGAYLTDLIISGPDTSLLAPSEKATILDFIKSTCLMVFAYFFGTKAANTAPGE